MVIHSENEEIVREFALKKPVSRLLVNTPGTLGGIGATTAIAPALTLGCGAVGGSSTSDNISPLNLLNIRRVAYGLREMEDLAEKPAAQTEAASIDLSDKEQLINMIVKRILAEM